VKHPTQLAACQLSLIDCLIVGLGHQIFTRQLAKAVATARFVSRPCEAVITGVGLASAAMADIEMARAPIVSSVPIALGVRDVTNSPVGNLDRVNAEAKYESDPSRNKHSVLAYISGLLVMQSH